MKKSLLLRPPSVVGLACLAFSVVGTLAHAQIEAPTVKDALTVEQLAPLVGGPSLVTLQGKDIPLQTAVDALLKAANLPSQDALYNANDATRTVTVNWKDTPFWDAAKSLETQTGLRWSAPYDRQSTSVLCLAQYDAFGRTNGLGGLSGAQTPLGVVLAGGVGQQVQRSLSFAAPAPGAPVANPQGNDGAATYLQVSAYLDPRLRVQPGSIRLELTTPVEQGRPINNRSGVSFVGADTLLGLSSSQLFLGDQANQTKVPLVQGNLYATVIQKLDTWELPNLVAIKTGARTANGTTYNLDDVILEGDKLTLKVSMHGAAVRELGGRTNFVMRLLDGEGKPVFSNGRSISGSGGAELDYKGEYRYSLRITSKAFPEGEVRPGPFKLVWDIPVETQTLKMPFQFRDVPLP